MAKAIAYRALKFFLAPFALYAVVWCLFQAWSAYRVNQCVAAGGSCSIVVTRLSLSWGDTFGILSWYAAACILAAWLWEMVKRHWARKANSSS